MEWKILLWPSLENKICHSVDTEINNNNNRTSVGGRESEPGVKMLIRKNKELFCCRYLQQGEIEDNEFVGMSFSKLGV